MPKYSFILFFVSMTVRGATTQQLIDTSNSLLDLIITQSETVFIPRLFQPDINSLLDGLPEVSLIDYLNFLKSCSFDCSWQEVHDIKTRIEKTGIFSKVNEIFIFLLIT